MRTTEDMRRLLLAGADKCSMNSAAVARPELVAEAAAKFGSQCVVVAVDARADGHGGWEVFTHGGRTPTGLDVVAWCRQVASTGAGEILLTSMDRDGTGRGFDLALLRAVCDAVRVPVVASGGVGEPAHFVEGAQAGASGLLAASVFHFGSFHIGQVKQALRDAGLPVRPPASSQDIPAGPSSRSAPARRSRPRPSRAVVKKSVPKKSVLREAGRAASVDMTGATAAVLDRLFDVVTSRRNADPNISHSARLLSRGTAKVAQKFGEEAVECLIEAVSGNSSKLIGESADVLYHLIVLWVDAGVHPGEVWAELERREGVSGIAEKASRRTALPPPAGSGEGASCR